MLVNLDNSMKIKIRCGKNDEINLCANRGSKVTIKDMKHKIEQIKGIPVNEQVLKLVKPIELCKDHYTIEECCVPHFILKRERLKKGVTVYIKTLNGSRYKLTNVDLNDTILSLKKQILENVGTPIDEQRLVHKGKEMKDHKMVEKYNVMNYDNISLSLRRRGG